MSSRSIPRRSRVAAYDAEDHVFGAKFATPMPSYAAIRELGARYAPEVIIRYGTRARSGRSGTFYYPTLTQPPRIMLSHDAGLPLVLHELAHALTPTESAHGPRWRATYVELVRREMSPWWADRLARAFRLVGYPPVDPTLCAELPSGAE